jgi:hypothetical protein
MTVGTFHVNPLVFYLYFTVGKNLSRARAAVCDGNKGRHRDGWRRVIDAHPGHGCRYIVESDELLNAFLELGDVAVSPELPHRVFLHPKDGNSARQMTAGLSKSPVA